MARSPRELVVNITSDVSDFVRGTQDADRATAAFVTEAESDFGKVSTAARDMAADANTAFTGMASDAKKQFGKIGTDAGHEMAGGPVKASFKDAGSEVGAEFASNLGESLASSDLSSVAKDTAGGLVSAFAGIGGPIGVGLAGVATVATSIFAKIQAEAEAKAARIAAVTGAIFDQMTEDMNTALGDLMRGQGYNAFVQGFSKDGDLNEGFREMSKLAQKAGVNVADIAAAFIQGGPAADSMRAKLAAAVTQGTKLVPQAKGASTQLSSAARAAGTLSSHLSEADTASSNAAAAAHAMWESMIGATASSREYERNMANAARSSGTIRQNQAGRAAPGTVTGGRAARV